MPSHAHSDPEGESAKFNLGQLPVQTMFGLVTSNITYLLFSLLSLLL